MFKYMAEEKGDALSRHTAFDPAAAKGFGQVEQILHHPLFGVVLGLDVTIISKEVAQFTEIVADGVLTVMADS